MGKKRDISFLARVSRFLPGHRHFSLWGYMGKKRDISFLARVSRFLPGYLVSCPGISFLARVSRFLPGHRHFFPMGMHGQETRYLVSLHLVSCLPHE
jgi:hypothetical protein